MTACADREPDDEYHVLSGAGHRASLDGPDETDALIAGFLQRHVLLAN